MTVRQHSRRALKLRYVNRGDFRGNKERCLEIQKSKHRLDMETGVQAGEKASKQKGKHIEMASQRMGRTENMGDFGQA